MRELLTFVLIILLCSNSNSQTVNISVGGTFTQCLGSTTDSDASGGNYGPNESYTVTICSDGTGNTITLDFSAGTFDIDASDHV